MNYQHIHYHYVMVI